MSVKKLLKMLISFCVFCSIMVTSYAADVDTIFGITAHASDATSRATSLIQFYKEGSSLDRKKVSNDELYVFGVFVSNFLMPFQSNVGNMASDAFVTKMAQTFFGDAFTAQQLSDMKYTLGLVQSAQASRRKVVIADTGDYVSVISLYTAFSGFYSMTQSLEFSGEDTAPAGEGLLKDFSYEGAASEDDIIWTVGSSIFDAVLGQLISVCPTQAGLYLGDPLNQTRLLYVDCFGNISDATGVIIIPACMNPYAFYNHYLDAYRKPLAEPWTESIKRDKNGNIANVSTCPLQLPINNAFWMGTMVTPQDTMVLAKTEYIKTTRRDEPVGDSSHFVVAYVEREKDSPCMRSLDTHLVAQGTAGATTWYMWTPFGTITFGTVCSTFSNFLQGSKQGFALGCFFQVDVNNYEDGEGRVSAMGIAADSTNIFVNNVTYQVQPYLYKKDVELLDLLKAVDPYCDAITEKDGSYDEWEASDNGKKSVARLKALRNGILTAIDPLKDKETWFGIMKDLTVKFSDIDTQNKLIKQFFKINDDGTYRLAESGDSDVGLVNIGQPFVEQWPKVVTGNYEDSNGYEPILVYPVGDMVDVKYADDTPAGALQLYMKLDYVTDDKGNITGLKFPTGLVNDSGSFTMQNTIVDIQGVIESTVLMKPLVALGTLGGITANWSRSGTILTGIQTYDGSEIGVYFTPSMFTSFYPAYVTAQGIQVKADGTPNEYYSTVRKTLQKKGNWIDTWSFVGGTALPRVSVLDDVALFNTYSSFSETAAENIEVISMYTNKETGTWWAADPLYGTSVNSVFADFLQEAATILLTGELKDAGNELYLRAMVHRDGLEVEYDYTKTSVDDCIAKIASVALDSKVTSSAAQNGAVVPLFEGLQASLHKTGSKNSSAEAVFDKAVEKMAAYIEGKSHIGLSIDAVPVEIAKRALLAFLMNDPCWLTVVDNPPEETIWAVAPYYLEDVGITDNYREEGAADNKNLSFDTFSKRMPSIKKEFAQAYLDKAMKFTLFDDAGLSWNHIATEETEVNNIGDFFARGMNHVWYANHSFLQKVHIAKASGTQSNGWFLVFGGFVLAGLAVIATIAIVVAATVLTGGAAVLVMIAGIAVAAAVLVLSAVSISSSVDASAQKTAQMNYYKDVSGVGYNGYINRLMKNNPGDGSILWCVTNSTHINGTQSEWQNRKDPTKTAFTNAYMLNYTLYSPIGDLATGLAGLSKAYDENGILNDAGEVTSRVGSYITVDANLWGGIYYAYMVDIFGLTVNDADVMSAAQLKTNLPPIPRKLTNSTFLDISDMLSGGADKHTEEQEAELRWTLMNRLDAMTDTKNNNFIGEWINNAMNSWLIKTHKAIAVNGTSNADDIGNIGSGTLYQGYSGYLSTATIEEMPFTSWVLDYYPMIYVILLVTILVLLVCMVAMGQKTKKKAAIAFCLLAVILLLPRLTVDAAVATNNTIASNMFADRFNFWAYTQYQQYITKVNAAGDEQHTEHGYLKYLVVTNIQQAKDYYDSENGVNLKWMAPKKDGLWNKINNITGGADDGLNLSIFKWMFRGQLTQEKFSGNDMDTFLYRPFNDISMTARQFIRDDLSKNGGAVLGTDYKSSSNIKMFDFSADSTLNGEKIARREQFAALSVANLNQRETWAINNFDVVPSLTYMQGDNRVSRGGAVATSDASLIPAYVYNVYSPYVFDRAYKNFIYLEPGNEDAKKEYLKVYPCTLNASTTGDTFRLVPDGASGDNNLKLYYLYTESPYYYFYFMFNQAAQNYTTGSESSFRKLLTDEYYFKYKYDTFSTELPNAADVKDASLQDFLDLRNLFTYIIPYMRQANLYVEEWTDLWGMERSSTNEDFNKDLEQIWRMYTPWVDLMYDASYQQSTARLAGQSIVVNDAINPGSYPEGRPMVFSDAQMQRAYLTQSDLTGVEKRIQQTLKDTYEDLMYLNNYTQYDNDVLISAAAMIATFNFNKNFSDTSLFGENIQLYPTGFELPQFTYDSYMRMALLNSTGESVFSEQDIYNSVVENSSWFSGLLLVLNDVCAVYIVPFMKSVVLILLFFLGVLICAVTLFAPKEEFIRFLGKHFLLPLAAFFGILLSMTVLNSLFVGEGVSDLVGQRGVTISTGNPVLMIILMLVTNILAIIALFKVIMFTIKSYGAAGGFVLKSATSLVGATASVAGAAVGFGKKTVGMAGRAVAGIGRGIKHGAERIADKRTADTNTHKITDAIEGQRKASKKSAQPKPHSDVAKNQNEAPKAEETKQEAPKQEAPKQEAPKQEAPKKEEPKKEETALAIRENNVPENVNSNTDIANPDTRTELETQKAKANASASQSAYNPFAAMAWNSLSDNQQDLVNSSSVYANTYESMNTKGVESVIRDSVALQGAADHVADNILDAIKGMDSIVRDKAEFSHSFNMLAAQIERDGQNMSDAEMNSAKQRLETLARGIEGLTSSEAKMAEWLAQANRQYALDAQLAASGQTTMSSFVGSVNNLSGAVMRQAAERSERVVSAYNARMQSDVVNTSGYEVDRHPTIGASSVAALPTSAMQIVSVDGDVIDIEYD